MNRYLSSFVPQIMAGVMMLLCAGAPNGLASTSPSGASQKARVFLAGLCDPELGLLPEYRGAKVYWLFHDNADLLLLACIAERIMPDVLPDPAYISASEPKAKEPPVTTPPLTIRPPELIVKV